LLKKEAELIAEAVGDNQEEEEKAKDDKDKEPGPAPDLKGNKPEEPEET